LRPTKNIHLADVDPLFCRLQRMQHGKQGVPVFLDLRPLVTVVGVFDGQRMQIEFIAHLVQLRRRGIAQGHPDKTIRLPQIIADCLNPYISELFPFAVGDTVDQHALGSISLSIF